MNDYVIAGKKLYALKDKIIRSKAGREYINKHVKITVATDFYSGRQIQHDYTGKTNFEVQAKIDDSTRLSDEQLNLTANELTLRQLVGEYVNYKKNFVCGDSLAIIVRICEKYIFPRIGDIKIKKLTRADIIHLQNDIHAVSVAKTIETRAFYIIKNVMDYACRRGYLSCNPCIRAKLRHFREPEQTILNNDQLYKIIVTEKDSPYANFFAVILFMALRVGEALGLSWDQINWDRKTVIISQQCKVSGELQKSTKTKVNRCITVPECALLYLKRQKEIQDQQKSSNPNWNNPNNLVFTDLDGKPFGRGATLYAFKRIMRDTSNPKVTLHSLRRTMASILAENVSIRSSQYYLGHVSQKTSIRYVYPSIKNVEHLVYTMDQHFLKSFTKAGLMEVYKQ